MIADKPNMDKAMSLIGEQILRDRPDVVTMNILWNDDGTIENIISVIRPGVTA